MPLQTVVTGTIYDAHGDPARGVRVFVLTEKLTGTVTYYNSQEVARSNASGVLLAVIDGDVTTDVGFEVLRNSVVKLQGKFFVGSTSFSSGVTVQIPDAATATLESLGAAVTGPTTGVTTKSNGSALANLINVFDFSADFTVSESPTGEANIGIAGSSSDPTLVAIGNLSTSADKGIYFTGVDTASLFDLSAFARTFLDDANAAAVKATLGITDGQPLDAELTALAGLTSAANKLPYFTGSGTASLADLSAFARTFLDDADAATVRATLGIAAGGTTFSSANYASLSAAVTAIGSTPGALFISAANFPSGASCTVPSTLTLDFGDVGTLLLGTGHVVTILSDPGDWPIRKLFYNAFASQGTIRFTDGTNTDGTYNIFGKTLWVEQWGAKGDNLDASAAENADALEAAQVATPFGWTLRLAGKFYKVDRGITWEFTFQNHVLGNTGQVGYSDNFTQPTIVYQGTNGGTALTIKNAYADTVQGIGVFCNDGVDTAVGAAIGILITFAASGYPALTSHCNFQGITVKALNTRTDWIGIKIDNPSGQNNEHHQFDEIYIYGGMDSVDDTDQIGIMQAHSQVKSIIYNRLNINNVGTGIHFQGNFHSTNNSFVTVGTLYYGNYVVETTTIRGDDVEGGKYVFRANEMPGGSIVEFQGNRYANISAPCDAIGTAAFQLDAQGRLALRDNYFATTSGLPFGPFFVSGPNDGNLPVVEWVNNMLSGPQDVLTLTPGFQTVLCSINDGRKRVPIGGSQYSVGEDDYRLTPVGLTSPAYAAFRRGVNFPGIQNNLFGDQLIVGDGELGVKGLFMPNRPTLTVVGTTGATTRRVTIMAVDAAGRRSLAFEDAAAGFVAVTNSNATLTGSNRIDITWLAQHPVPDHYEVWDVKTDDASLGRKIADVTPSGTATESYSWIANLATSYAAFRPGWNEAGVVNINSPLLFPNEVTFTAGDTTPSVSTANDFVIPAAVTITNFDDPTNGKVIRARVAAASVVIANNANIVTGTGGNITAVNGAVYKFIYRGSAWRGVNLTAASGGVDTANSPNANEFARFTDADTIEGRTASETRSDLGLGSFALVTPTETPNGTKFLRDDNSWQAIPGGGDALVANPLSQFAATTSAQLAGVLTDETGDGGGFARAANPTFTNTVTLPGVKVGYTTATANTTLTEAIYTLDCTANSFNVTLETAVGCAGRLHRIKNSGSGVITILTTSSQTVDEFASGAVTLNQYDCLDVESNGANWMIV